MRNEIWKSKAYKNTNVNFIKSQIQINKLLNANGINDFQHTSLSGSISIIFIKVLEIEGKKMKVGIKINIPNATDKNRNQLYRALFYYLKAKFESLTFGFVEEYNEAFVKEFMPYLITNKQGKTVADLILPQLNKAITYTPSGEQLYLESSKKENKWDEIDERDEIIDAEIIEEEEGKNEKI